MKQQPKGSLADQLKAQLGLGQDYEPAEDSDGTSSDGASETTESVSSASSSSSAMRSLADALKGVKLIASIEKKGRAGKQVTLVQGFTALDTDDYVFPDEEIEPLAHLLKTRLGVGGTVKDGEIIIQGDHREKIVQILKAEGFNAKRGN